MTRSPLDGIFGEDSSSGSSSDTSGSNGSSGSGDTSDDGDERRSINPGDVSSEFVDREIDIETDDEDDDHDEPDTTETDADDDSGGPLDGIFGGGSSSGGSNGSSSSSRSSGSSGTSNEDSSRDDDDGQDEPETTGTGTNGSDRQSRGRFGGGPTGVPTPDTSEMDTVAEVDPGPAPTDDIDEDNRQEIREEIAERSRLGPDDFTITDVSTTGEPEAETPAHVRNRFSRDERRQIREEVAADSPIFDADDFVITDFETRDGEIVFDFETSETEADIHTDWFARRDAIAEDVAGEYEMFDPGDVSVTASEEDDWDIEIRESARRDALFDQLAEEEDEIGPGGRFDREDIVFEETDDGLQASLSEDAFSEDAFSEDDESRRLFRSSVDSTPGFFVEGDEETPSDSPISRGVEIQTVEMESEVDTELTPEQSFLDDISGGRFAPLVQAGDDARAAITPGDDIPDRGVAADIAASGFLAPAAVSAGALSTAFTNVAGEPTEGTMRTDRDLSTPSFDEASDAVTQTRGYDLTTSTTAALIRPEATIASDLENIGAGGVSRPDRVRTEDVQTESVSSSEAVDAVIDTRTFSFTREAAGSVVRPEATIASDLENVGAGGVTQPERARVEDVDTASVSSSEAADAVADTRAFNLSREAVGTLATPEATMASDLENVGAGGVSRPDARRTQNVETGEVTLQEGRDAFSGSVGSGLSRDVTGRLLTPEAIVADALQGFDGSETRSEARRTEREPTGPREMSDPILGAAAAGVIAPEPVSTIGGGIILGGAALAAGAGALGRRAEIEVPTEPQTEQGELEIDPQDVADSPSGEISVPEEGFTPTGELAVGDGTVDEIRVPDGTEQTDIGELQLSQLVEPVQREREEEQNIPFERGPEISEEEVLRNGDNTLIIETPGSEFDYTDYQPVRFPADEVRQVEFEERSVEEPQFLESRGGSQTLTRQHPRARSGLAPDAGLRGEQDVGIQSRLDAVVETGLDTRFEARTRMTTATESVAETVQAQETVNVNEFGMQYGFPNQPGRIDRPTGRIRNLRVPRFDGESQYDPTSTDPFDVDIQNPIATAADVIGVGADRGQTPTTASTGSFWDEPDPSGGEWAVDEEFEAGAWETGDFEGSEWDADAWGAEMDASGWDASGWDASGWDADAWEAESWEGDGWGTDDRDRRDNGGLFGGLL